MARTGVGVTVATASASVAGRWRLVISSPPRFWTKLAMMLLMLPAPGTSCSSLGHEGHNDTAACTGHVACGTRLNQRCRGAYGIYTEMYSVPNGEQAQEGTEMLTKKAAKQLKTAPSKPRKVLPKIKVDVSVTSVAATSMTSMDIDKDQDDEETEDASTSKAAPPNVIDLPDDDEDVPQKTMGRKGRILSRRAPASKNYTSAPNRTARRQNLPPTPVVPNTTHPTLTHNPPPLPPSSSYGCQSPASPCLPLRAAAPTTQRSLDPPSHLRLALKPPLLLPGPRPTPEALESPCQPPPSPASLARGSATPNLPCRQIGPPRPPLRRIRSSPASLSAGSGCPDLCLPSPRPTDVTVALSSPDPVSLPWPSPPHTPPQLASSLPPMSRRCYIIRRGSGCTAPGALAHPMAMAGSPLPACPFPPAALMAASPVLFCSIAKHHRRFWLQV
ncbi:vegetative cell wall protein gp1-like [Triticum dicoccoides]|uniref:vegetative cell wall protein gp1-like n=1 Tax=Triticum dicoccoides TaxID=85692 RepID=UPI0018916998|nr:vegetative cell wall protein gp1-like [Triticum dicoccoides]